MGIIEEAQKAGRLRANAVRMKQFIIDAVESAKSGNMENIDLIVTLIETAEQAKQILRAKGYGVAGTPIVETAQEVPDSDY